MIVFDLRCSAGHVFEAWFASSDRFEDQRGRALVACPLCDDTQVAKAAMAPAIPAKTNRQRDTAALLAAQRAIEARAVYVGADFAARARALHAGGADAAAGGDAPHENSANASGSDSTPPSAGIYGEASLAEARALVEDGIPILPLPFRARVRSDA